MADIHAEKAAPKFGVQAGVLSKEIHVGRLNKAGNAFLDGKEVSTDMVLAATAQYVRHHFDGGMAVTFPGLGIEMTVKIAPLANAEPSTPPGQRT